MFVFSARLDEKGTDELSPYTALAGAVALPNQWDELETAWERLLKRYKIPTYHGIEFKKRIEQFNGWSDGKCKRFRVAQKKIINKHTLFRISVGIDKKTHAEIKKRMRGIKGFRADSDYGLCLRYLMFLACEHLKKIDGVPPDFRLSLLLETGPWAKGAKDTYSRVSRMTNTRWKPAKHAHRLAGIEFAPKGEYRSLEAADYLVEVAHRRMMDGEFSETDGPQVSILLNRSMLERWYEGMLKEKEHRRAHGKRKTTN